MSQEVVQVQETQPAKRSNKGDARVNLLVAIADAARDPRIDAIKMRDLYEIQKSIEERDARAAFYRSMIAVQEEIAPIVRDAKNPATNSRYARLQQIDAALRPIYTKHGFALSFSIEPDSSVPSKYVIRCTVFHRAGHAESFTLPYIQDEVNRAKTGLMALGASATYSRRYLTCLIFNAVFADDPDDNDGAPIPVEPEKLEKINAIKAKLQAKSSI